MMMMVMMMMSSVGLRTQTVDLLRHAITVEMSLSDLWRSLGARERDQ